MISPIFRASSEKNIVFFFLEHIIIWYFVIFLVTYWPNHQELQNIQTAFLQRGKTLTTSILDIKRNNLMVRLQWCWSFGECRVLLSLPSLPSSLWLGVVAPHRVLSMEQIELNCILMLNCIIPGLQGSIPVRVIPKTQKMILDAALFDAQLYKVRIKGKVEQFKEWSSGLTSV